MARALFYCGIFAFAVSCKPNAPAPALLSPDADALSIDAAAIPLDASSARPPISDAGDTVAAGHGKVVLVSDADARSFAAGFIGGASFAHPVFSGNFGPSTGTMFGITQTETMSPYSALALAPDREGAWKKIETEPLTDTPWNGWSVDAVMFEDIDGNGVLAPIVIAEYMTGIGPTGAQPFVFVSVYRFKNGKMIRASDIEKILSGAENSAAIRNRLAARKGPKKP